MTTGDRGRGVLVGSRRVVVLACALAVAVLGDMSHVRADAAAQARFFDELARRAYARARWEEALRFFLYSEQAARSPGTLYNIGVTGMLAGEHALAYTHLDEYLASAPSDDSRREDAVRRMSELAPRLATIHVESDPPGASISIDRRELGTWGTTPRTVVVPPGAHTISLSLADHLDASAEVDAVVGTRVETRLVLAARTGTLEITAEPSVATITVIRDDVVLARSEGVRPPVPATSDGRRFTLAVGRVRVRAEAAGYVATETDAVVRADTVERVHIAAREAPGAHGRLLVATGSVTARVLIDGVARASTPAALDVPVGRHHVRVEAARHAEWRGEVVITAGRSRLLELTLARRRAEPSRGGGAP